MSLDPSKVYKVLRVAYKHGILDKFNSIFEEAVDRLMTENDLQLVDLLNSVDNVQAETIERVEKRLNYMGPFIGLAANDRLMSFVSKTMDMALVRKFTISFLKKSFEKKLPEAACVKQV